MNQPRTATEISKNPSHDDGDPNRGLSPDELEEIREALHLLRALRALVKTGAVDLRGPVKVTRTTPPSDEQYARAIANVNQRMKGAR